MLNWASDRFAPRIFSRRQLPPLPPREAYSARLTSVDIFCWLGLGGLEATQRLGSAADRVCPIGIGRVTSAFTAIAFSKSSKANDDMIASYTRAAPQLALRLV
jgi:hypothetical protein